MKYSYPQSAWRENRPGPWFDPLPVMTRREKRVKALAFGLLAVASYVLEWRFGIARACVLGNIASTFAFRALYAPTPDQVRP